MQTQVTGVCFHAIFTTPIYGQNLHNHIITCKVTWRQRSRDHSTRYRPFPIGGPLEPSLYLQSFWRYWVLKIRGSRPWPLYVTWRHRSRDHSTRDGPFHIGAPLWPSLSLTVFKIFGPKLRLHTDTGWIVIAHARYHMTCTLCKIWVHMLIFHPHIAYSLW